MNDRIIQVCPFDEERRKTKAKICRWCGKPLPGRRRSWCSGECEREFDIRSNPSYARSQVFNRDGGICSCCGLDTKKLDQVGSYLRRHCGHAKFCGRKTTWGWSKTSSTKGKWAREFEAKYPWWRYDLTAWQADHIVAVAEGGGGCGLDGYQTLCIGCHNKDTADLAARLAKQKRIERTGQLEMELNQKVEVRVI